MIKTGWVLSALVVLFLLGASATPKLMGSPLALEPLAVVGWPAKYLLLIGIIEIVCAVLYIIPRTALLGAVLMTALLGAALCETGVTSDRNVPRLPWASSISGNR